MRFFHQGDDAARAAAEQERARDAQSQAMLERGDLPLRAHERLHRQSAGGGALRWSSDLSVGEYLATRSVRLEPLGQVLGGSIYHIAYNAMNAQQNYDGELTVFSQALYDARNRALGRLRQEAALLGAHGVVGVRLERQAYEWGQNLLEFTAIGTAVRVTGVPPLPRPFLSDMSGQETLAALRTGYTPVDIAMGVCAYYVVTTWDDLWQMSNWGNWSNNEMARLTGATYQARRGAMSRMTAEAHGWGADGIVGSDVTMETYEVRAYRTRPYSNETEDVEDHVVEFTVVGTAVAAIGRGHEAANAALILDLSSETPSPPTPLPVRGRGEPPFDTRGDFLPSPLEGEGSGVRDEERKRCHYSEGTTIRRRRKTRRAWRAVTCRSTPSSGCARCAAAAARRGYSRVT